MPYMLIMECYAISQIYCFANVLFIAASALYHIDYIFDLHDISSFTLNNFPLKFAKDPSVYIYIRRDIVNQLSR